MFFSPRPFFTGERYFVGIRRLSPAKFWISRGNYPASNLHGKAQSADFSPFRRRNECESERKCSFWTNFFNADRGWPKIPRVEVTAANFTLTRQKLSRFFTRRRNWRHTSTIPFIHWIVNVKMLENLFELFLYALHTLQFHGHTKFSSNFFHYIFAPAAHNTLLALETSSGLEMRPPLAPSVRDWASDDMVFPTHACLLSKRKERPPSKRCFKGEKGRWAQLSGKFNRKQDFPSSLPNNHFIQKIWSQDRVKLNHCTNLLFLLYK